MRVSKSYDPISLEFRKNFGIVSDNPAWLSVQNANKSVKFYLAFCDLKMAPEIGEPEMFGKLFS